jgi:hypothetical protein
VNGEVTKSAPFSRVLVRVLVVEVVVLLLLWLLQQRYTV